MVSDSISNASIPKDFSKKKRGNRSAKLKQCKLDARREQWLSQVKNKGSKEELNSRGVAYGPGRLIDIKPEGEGDNEGCRDNYSDFDSTSNSPSSSSAGFCSVSMTEEDNEGDDICLDDWEAVADALAATDKKQHTPERDGNLVNMSFRVWQPDDAFWPQSLPNLLKHSGSVCGCKSLSIPSCGFRLCMWM